MAKRFSLKNKLILIFGALIALASSIEGLFAVNIAKKAVTEKVEAQLTDKANDTVQIIDGRIAAFFQFLEGIARMPVLRDAQATFAEKMEQLEKEAKFNTVINALHIADSAGTVRFLDGTSVETADYPYFKASISGKRFFSEPYMDPSVNKFIMDISVPVYGDGKNVIGVLIAEIDGLWLSDQISDIVVGQTGYAYINGVDGTNIADPDSEVVKSMWNTLKKAKTDSSLQSLVFFVPADSNSLKLMFLNRLN